MIQAALPPEAPPVVIVEAAADRTPLIMFGFFAFGDVDDLRRLGRAARQAGMSSSRVEGAAVPEWGVFFPIPANREAALAFYRRARSGEFGQLRITPLVITVEDARDGIDAERELRVVEPSYLAEPQS